MFKVFSFSCKSRSPHISLQRFLKAATESTSDMPLKEPDCDEWQESQDCNKDKISLDFLQHVERISTPALDLRNKEFSSPSTNSQGPGNCEGSGSPYPQDDFLEGSQQQVRILFTGSRAEREPSSCDKKGGLG